MTIGLVLLAHDVQAIDEGTLALDTFAHARYLQALNRIELDRNTQVTKRALHYVKMKDR